MIVNCSNLWLLKSKDNQIKKNVFSTYNDLLAQRVSSATAARYLRILPTQITTRWIQIQVHFRVRIRQLMTYLSCFDRRLIGGPLGNRLGAVPVGVVLELLVDLVLPGASEVLFWGAGSR